MKEILAIIRPDKLQPTREALHPLGIDFIVESDVLGRGREKGVSHPKYLAEGTSTNINFLKKRVLSFLCPEEKVNECLASMIEVNRTGRIGDGKIFVMPVLAHVEKEKEIR
jgi:nitrogen regulatory protein PII 2